MSKTFSTSRGTYRFSDLTGEMRKALTGDPFAPRYLANEVAYELSSMGLLDIWGSEADETVSGGLTADGRFIGEVLT